jgi:hypothetical protein
MAAVTLIRPGSFLATVFMMLEEELTNTRSASCWNVQLLLSFRKKCFVTTKEY